MANIQSTQYANPDPGQAPILAQLAAGFLKGGSGQLAMQQQQQQQQDEENRKAMANLAVAFAGKGQLMPGQAGDPNGINVGNRNFAVTPPNIDSSNALDTLKLRAIMAQMQGQQPMGGGAPAQSGSYNPAAAQALFNGGQQGQAQQQQKPNPFVKKQTGVSDYGISQYADTANPDYEQFIKDEQPLQADAATKYSGSIQGINDIKDIVKTLGITENGVNPKAKDLIYRANLNIEGSSKNNSWGGNLIPGLDAAYKAQKLARGGDQGAELGNKFLTLAENILRARTGAAAQDQELVREEARTLLRSYIESPHTWIQKLQQNEQFLAGTARTIRPRKWTQDIAEFGQGAGVMKTGSESAVPATRPAGATHYSPSTKLFYDDQGNVVQ